MVDDQGATFGSLSNSSSSTGTDGPTDPSEPDAELSTDIALLLNSATNSPSSTDTDTDTDTDGDGATAATPGTIDWLNPGAENDPLFTDSADQGDSEQQTGSGMVDDQGNDPATPTTPSSPPRSPCSMVPPTRRARPTQTAKVDAIGTQDSDWTREPGDDDQRRGPFGHGRRPRQRLRHPQRPR